MSFASGDYKNNNHRTTRHGATTTNLTLERTIRKKVTTNHESQKMHMSAPANVAHNVSMAGEGRAKEVFNRKNRSSTIRSCVRRAGGDDPQRSANERMRSL